MRFKVIAALVVVTALMGASAGVALATSRSSGTAASASTTPSTPAGGSVRLFVTPSATGNGGGAVVVTGAIGDYGKTTGKMDKNGKANKNGNYGKLVLQQGTIEVDLTTFDTKTNNAQPDINNTTCSAALAVTAPVTLFNGTGLYEGITGTVHLTETYAVILPRYTSGKNKGQCNYSNNAQPLAQWGSIAGTGRVSFS
jgi:hypothetical protein